MAVNNQPIFTLTPDIGFAKGTSAAYVSYVDNISGNTLNTNLWLLFTAGTNGSYIQKIRFRGLGSTSATVARIWLNNGLTTATAANSVLYDEISLPALTALSQAALNAYEIPMNMTLPYNTASAVGYKLYLTYGSTVGSPGFDVCAVGGDY